jgi:hypothetical protein
VGYSITFCMKLIAVTPEDCPFCELVYNIFLRMTRQFFLTPNGQYCFTYWLPQFYQNLITTWQFRLFQFCNRISTSRWWEPGTSGSAVCISICLTIMHEGECQIVNRFLTLDAHCELPQFTYRHVNWLESIFYKCLCS